MQAIITIDPLGRFSRGSTELRNGSSLRVSALKDRIQSIRLVMTVKRYNGMEHRIQRAVKNKIGRLTVVSEAEDPIESSSAFHGTYSIPSL